MRFLVKVSLPVEQANAAFKSGKFAQIVQSILAEIKPEATYFIEENGKRGAYIFCDLQDASQIPAVAEPWFLALNASVEFHPAMTPADLAKAGPAIEQAVKKYA
jgi:hypothetical protein